MAGRRIGGNIFQPGGLPQSQADPEAFMRGAMRALASGEKVTLVDVRGPWGIADEMPGGHGFTYGALLRSTGAAVTETPVAYSPDRPTTRIHTADLYMQGCTAKPCSGCPFRAESAPGWLGPWTPEALHAHVMQESPFICHKSIDAAIHNEDTSAMRICGGALRYMVKACKRPRFAPLAALVDAVKGDTEGIMNPREFIAHHSR